MRKLLISLLFIFATAQLTACSALDGFNNVVVGGIDKLPFVYKIEVRQGNLVTQNMIDQLRPGMDERQVTFLMGTPLLVDPFNSNRWDYSYTLKKSNGEKEEKKITLIFEDGALVNLNGDYKPNIETQPMGVNTEVVDVPKRELRKKGLFERMLHFVGIEYDEKY